MWSCEPQENTLPYVWWRNPLTPCKHCHTGSAHPERTEVIDLLSSTRQQAQSVTHPSTNRDQFKVELWRVPHVGQEMLTLSGTPDLTPTGVHIHFLPWVRSANFVCPWTNLYGCWSWFVCLAESGFVVLTYCYCLTSWVIIYYMSHTIDKWNLYWSYTIKCIFAGIKISRFDPR